MSIDNRLVDNNGRPNFAGFAKALQAEAKWIAMFHHRDKTGSAQNDTRLLNELAKKVEQVGRELGYI